VEKHSDDLLAAIRDHTLTTHRSGPRRWREQRWLVDEAIRSSGGIEWDQPRLAYTLGPSKVSEAGREVAFLRSAITKMADFVPAVAARAVSHERRAQAAEADGHPITAGEHWYQAAMLWALSVWPLWERDDSVRDAIDSRKNAAYLGWARSANHRIEAVEIPFGDVTLPAWLHIAPGAVEPFPIVLSCGGMDSSRESIISRVGDELLDRGLSVLAFDGPGQAESACRGIHVTATNWEEAGRAVIDWCRADPRIDDGRMAMVGKSFGSFWIVQAAARHSELVGVASLFPVFEPGCRTIFESASPTFKARHMFMAGLFDDEDAFDELAAQYDLRDTVPHLAAPWLVVGGTDDELSDSTWVPVMTDLATVPTETLLYAGAKHSLSGAMSPVFGPGWKPAVADWLLDRFNGKPLETSRRLVMPDGSVRTE
jgi:pimeloyl-ACP methyl ester carboxylesterase